jgi:hypothetical protein
VHRGQQRKKVAWEEEEQEGSLRRSRSLSSPQ